MPKKETSKQVEMILLRNDRQPANLSPVKVLLCLLYVMKHNLQYTPEQYSVMKGKDR